MCVFKLSETALTLMQPGLRFTDDKMYPYKLEDWVTRGKIISGPSWFSVHLSEVLAVCLL